MGKQSIIAILVVVLVAGTIIFYKTKTTTEPEVSSTVTTKTSTPALQEKTTVKTAVSKAVVEPVSQTPTKESVTGKYDVLITLTKNGFVPERIEVKAGQTIRFLNSSGSAMRIASNPHPTHEIYSELNQNNTVGKGGYYDFIFLRVGAWGYHNHTDPIKGGIVIVHLQ